MGPTLKQMALQAISAHEGHATFAEIKDYVRSHFDPVNETSLNCQVNSSCVNVQSRVNYPENQRRKVCTAGKGNDLFYKVGHGEFAIYDPRIHGQWEIVAGDSSGKGSPAWVVQQVPRVLETEPPPPALSLPPQPSSLELRQLRAAELGEIRRRLMALLDQFDTKIGAEPVGARIGRLTHSGKLPKQVGKVMSMIVEYRNLAEYETGVLTPAETETILSSWKVILEWSASKGYSLRPLD